MLVEKREQQLQRTINRKNSPSPNGNQFKTKVIALAARAREIKKQPLTNVAHLIDEEWLHESWKRLNKGAAYGIDKVKVDEYTTDLDKNISTLLEKLKQGSYRAPPVKRVYIPKGKGKLRPLGLPTTEDKLAQRAVSIILTAVFEQEFLDFSYGFRSKRSAHQAVSTVRRTIATGKVSWIVDADIKSFFDNMNHKWLIKFVSHRIKDKAIIRLISKWLKAGVMEEGKMIKSSTGAPQGGVISPVLSNIYLHYVIDLWVEKVVKKHISGDMHCIRYADDTLFAFQYREDAVKFIIVLRKRLSKFSLELNEDKTKLCRFGKFAERDRERRGEKRSTFNFLGFTFYNSISRNGKYKVGNKTQSSRLSGSMSRVTAWLKANRHQAVPWQAKYLNAVLEGHYHYYGVTGNFKCVSAFYRHIIRTWHRYLSRRSQRSYIKWEKYLRILERFPLVKPYLPHSEYA